MRTSDEINLSPEEIESVHLSLLKGVVSRAGLLSWLFVITFAIYGFSSFKLIHSFMPELSLFANVWPRLLFNSLPFFLLGLYFTDYQTKLRLKLWIWILGYPLLYAMASMIYIWPLMYSGHAEIYAYVHGVNVFVLATVLIVSAAPPMYLVGQVAAYIIVFFVPVLVLLHHSGNHLLLEVVAGDMLLGVPTAAYCSYFIFKLRRKVAVFDLKIKKASKSFLGSTVAEAIYSDRKDLLKDRTTDAIIVVMDIRGYTKFYKAYEKEHLSIIHQFMTDYHALVSRHIGKAGGYWHKSHGDAHVASFGAMDSTADLTDVPGIDSELREYEKAKQQANFEKALKTIFSITYDFEALKEKYDIELPLSVGSAVAYGSLQVRLQGDDNHKQELDIDGEVIIRCTRLEAYTKIIRETLAPESSVLAVSPELWFLTGDKRVFETWSIAHRQKEPVRDYPEIQMIPYHIFRNTNEKRQAVRKLRAS